MRITLTIDDNDLLQARRLAREKGMSIGAAVSALLREGVRAQQHARASAAACKTSYGLLPARSEVITSGHVRRLMERGECCAFYNRLHEIR